MMDARFREHDNLKRLYRFSATKEYFVGEPLALPHQQEFFDLNLPAVFQPKKIGAGRNDFAGVVAAIPLHEMIAGG